MDQNFNIEDKFRDAFNSWEADYSPAEMQGDWSQLADKIPAGPGGAPAATAPAPGAGVWGVSKLLAISGIGAVVTAVSILVYTQINEPAVSDNNAGNQPIVANDLAPEAKEANPERNISYEAAKENVQIISAAEAEDKKPKNKTTDNKASNTTARHRATGNVPQTVRSAPATEVQVSQNVPQNPNTDVRNGIGGGGVNNDKPAIRPNESTLQVLDSIVCTGSIVRVKCHADLNSKPVVDWGDGKAEVCRKDMYHTYSDKGYYTLKYVYGHEKVEKIILVLEKPNADFRAEQMDGAKYKFISQMTSANDQIWFFNDGSDAIGGLNPEHAFPDTGTYEVKMVSMNTALCTDTIRKMVYVGPGISIPNVFTPNGDGVGDVLTIDISNEQHFHLKIYNRQGVVVFRSNNKADKWDGRDMNSGNMCQTGTYYLILEYRMAGGQPQVIKRSVTIFP